MKNINQIRIIKKKFADEYRDAFTAVGNNLATGIGKDNDTGEYTIVANLTSDKLKNSLPTEYHGVKVQIEIIGEIFAQ